MHTPARAPTPPSLAALPASVEGALCCGRVLPAAFRVRRRPSDPHVTPCAPSARRSTFSLPVSVPPAAVPAAIQHGARPEDGGDVSERRGHPILRHRHVSGAATAPADPPTCRRRLPCPASLPCLLAPPGLTLCAVFKASVSSLILQAVASGKSCVCCAPVPSETPEATTPAPAPARHLVCLAPSHAHLHGTSLPSRNTCRISVLLFFHAGPPPQHPQTAAARASFLGPPCTMTSSLTSASSAWRRCSAASRPLTRRR